jgi:hypothetical protein
MVDEEGQLHWSDRVTMLLEQLARWLGEMDEGWVKPYQEWLVRIHDQERQIGR